MLREGPFEVKNEMECTHCGMVFQGDPPPPDCPVICVCGEAFYPFCADIIEFPHLIGW